MSEEKLPRPAKYDLTAAVKHVVHDYVYLVAAGTDTQRHADPPFNHYAERTFHVHCRTLDEFFRGKTDIRVAHFTKRSFAANLKTWDDWEPHIQMHLMHLTAGRTKANVREWNGEPNKDFLTEFVEAWQAFVADLQDDLRPLFAEQLEAHRQMFKQHATREYPLLTL